MIMKTQRQSVPRFTHCECAAKCFDGKIITRTVKFQQIQFQNFPSVLVRDDGVTFEHAAMIIQYWNKQVGNTNYTYSLSTFKEHT